MEGRIFQFGNALGNGITGMVPPQGYACPDRHSKRDSFMNPQLLVYQQQAGPTVFNSPTSYEPPKSFPTDPLPTIEDLENLPDLPYNDPLDEFTFLGAATPEQFFPTTPAQALPYKRREESPASRTGMASARKRKRRRTLGFACNFDGCPKKFDLECEATKHFKSAHTKGKKSCPKCFRSFHWDKDVRRHLRQVHDIGIEKTELIVESQESSVPRSEGSSDDRQYIKRQVTTQILEPKRRPRSLSTVVTMMKALNFLTTKPKREDVVDTEDPSFLISQDSKAWYFVELQGVQTGNELRQRIIKAFPDPPGNFILNEFRTDKHIRVDELMEIASRAAQGQRALRIVLTQLARTSKAPAGTATT